MSGPSMTDSLRLCGCFVVIPRSADQQNMLPNLEQHVMGLAQPDPGDEAGCFM